MTSNKRSLKNTFYSDNDPHIEQLQNDVKNIVENLDDDDYVKDLQLVEILKKNHEINQKKLGNNELNHYEEEENLFRETLAITPDNEGMFKDERNAFMKNFEDFLNNLDLDHDPNKLQQQVDSYIGMGPSSYPFSL